jgi:hypothetical protein
MRSPNDIAHDYALLKIAFPGCNLRLRYGSFALGNPNDIAHDYVFLKIAIPGCNLRLKI